MYPEWNKSWLWCLWGKSILHLKLVRDQHTLSKESRGQRRCLCISQVYRELMKIIAQGWHESEPLGYYNYFIGSTFHYWLEIYLLDLIILVGSADCPVAFDLTGFSSDDLILLRLAPRNGFRCDISVSIMLFDQQVRNFHSFLQPSLLEKAFCPHLSHIFFVFQFHISKKLSSPWVRSVVYSPNWNSFFPLVIPVGYEVLWMSCGGSCG